MNILVTNNTLNTIGGSETYAYTLIRELNSRENINVEAYSHNIGFVANKISELGVKVINKITEDKYDLILASHTSTINKIRDLKGKKIQTCHGIYTMLEQPVRGLDHYVSISQEVCDHLEKKGFKSTIIHNGINCERFNSPKLINKQLKNVLSLSQSKELNDLLTKICMDEGYALVKHNKNRNPTFNIENEIKGADLVISLGRGVYESMACGKNVFILDRRHYMNRPITGDGLITLDNIDGFIKNNCSGRFTNKSFNSEQIREELKKYDQKLGPKMREYALENLNIKKQVDKYLSL